MAQPEKGARDADMKTHEVTSEIVDQLARQDPKRYRTLYSNSQLIEVRDLKNGRLWQKTRSSGWLLYE